MLWLSLCVVREAHLTPPTKRTLCLTKCPSSVSRQTEKALSHSQNSPHSPLNITGFEIYKREHEYTQDRTDLLLTKLYG